MRADDDMIFMGIIIAMIKLMFIFMMMVMRMMTMMEIMLLEAPICENVCFTNPGHDESKT